MKNPLFIIVGLFVVIIFGSLFIVWSVFIDGKMVRKPFVIENSMLQTDKETYRPGDMVYARMVFCKHRDIQGTVQWSLVDTYLKLFPPKSGVVAAGCHDLVVEVAKIPLDTYPQPYHFEGQLRYVINPFNDIIIPLQTNEFRVI